MRTENRDLSERLSERLLDFGADIIGLITKLNKTAAGRHIGDQLMRSATSCGANYEEARAAESRADFVHKMQVVLKELRESIYWLKLIKKSGPDLNGHLLPVLTEANELAAIFAKSVMTAKGQKS